MLKGVYPSNEYGNAIDGDQIRYSDFVGSPLSPLNNVGTLVKVSGKVTRLCNASEPTVFDIYIDDGSLPYDGWLMSALGIGNTNHPAGIRLRIPSAVASELPVIAEGDFLVATGVIGSISSSDLSTGNGTRCIRMIRVRKASDIEKVSELAAN